MRNGCPVDACRTPGLLFLARFATDSPMAGHDETDVQTAQPEANQQAWLPGRTLFRHARKLNRWYFEKAANEVLAMLFKDDLLRAFPP